MPGQGAHSEVMFTCMVRVSEHVAHMRNSSCAHEVLSTGMLANAVAGFRAVLPRGGFV